MPAGIELELLVDGYVTAYPHVFAAAVGKVRDLAHHRLEEDLGRPLGRHVETIGVVAGCASDHDGRFVPAHWPAATLVRITVRLVEENPA